MNDLTFIYILTLHPCMNEIALYFSLESEKKCSKISFLRFLICLVNLIIIFSTKENIKSKNNDKMHDKKFFINFSDHLDLKWDKNIMMMKIRLKYDIAFVGYGNILHLSLN